MEVRQPGVVPVSDTMAVAADERLEANIATTLRMRIGMELRAVSAEAVRQWVAGGPPPERPVEWECTWSGGACAAPAAGRQAGRVDAFPAEPVVFPSLVQQVPDELALQAFVALDGRQGSVQIRDMTRYRRLPERPPRQLRHLPRARRGRADGGWADALGAGPPARRSGGHVDDNGNPIQPGGVLRRIFFGDGGL